MNLLIGDVGNTVTKLSIVDEKIFKIKKIVYFPSTGINSKKILKRNFYNTPLYEFYLNGPSGGEALKQWRPWKVLKMISSLNTR